MVTFLLVERFLERLGSPRLFALQLLNRSAYILDCSRPLVFLVADHHLELRVDLQGGFATRALYFNQLAFAFCHLSQMLAQTQAAALGSHLEVRARRVASGL